MARQAKKVDVVLVGLGWTSSVMAMELADSGLEILALERGEDRDTVPDFAYPKIADELRYAIRHELMQQTAQSTLTVRHKTTDTALPYRRLGSFLPGNGVGGAGVHWNGMYWRPLAEELQLKTYITENFGADIIPDGMTIEDFGVTYDELEPHFDRFDKIIGASGKAGNIKGEVQPGGNPFEAPRDAEFPLPPLQPTLNSTMFSETTQGMGYHPFPVPAANASEPYKNAYGMQLGPCNYCGFCEQFGCLNYSKSSPQTCVLGALKQKKNFSYQTNAEVLRIELAADGKTTTGVTYADENGDQVFQPADLVILGAYSLNNVHLLLLSGIGTPYDPNSGTGTTGKNYAYQMTGGTTLFFEDKHFNPFVGAGAAGSCIDDFALSRIDFGEEGFIGSSFITSFQSNGQPIRSLSLPAGAPSWGAGWKEAAGKHYGHAMSIASIGSNMSYRDCYLDLDPTYRDKYGRPLMRMTFDWKPNDIRMTQYMKGKVEEIAREMKPDSFRSSFKSEGSHYDVRPYQTTHNVGGAIMGVDSKRSALNRYLQSWDVHNVFVLGANAFPQNIEYNPTGLVGALTLWAAKAIRDEYLPNPGPLM